MAKRFAAHQFGLGPEKNEFLESFALLLSSGIDLLSALSALRDDMRSARMRALVARMEKDTKNGAPLWKTLDAAGIFPHTAISLVRIGEESGRLTENLSVVVAQERKAHLFRSQVRSAMLYPMLVFGLSVVVAVGTSWFILPRLENVFGQLGINLPLATKLLLGLGKFLGEYGAFAVPALLLSFAFLFVLFFTVPVLRNAGGAVLFRVPTIRKLMQNIAVTQFSYLLGTMLKAGVPLIPSISSVAESSGSGAYHKFYLTLRQNLENGYSFTKSFAHIPNASKFIPVSVQHIIAAGEQSGKLPEALLSVSETFEQRTANAMKDLSVLIEPIMLFIVWIGVLLVALGIILPIYTLIGQFNR